MSLVPFGPADGGRLKPGDVVALHDDTLRSILDEPGSRVIAGRSGVGKTALLRRICAGLEEEDRIATPERVQVARPVDIEVSPIAAMFDERGQSEIWSKIWFAAVLRSFATGVMCRPQVYALTEYDELELRNSYPELLHSSADCYAPRAIWAEAAAIVNGASSAAELIAYLQQPSWARLQAQVLQILEASRPVAFLLDLDDHYIAAVPGWVPCQHGLVRAVAELDNSPLGRFLHLVATTREQQYVALFDEGSNIDLKRHVVVVETDERDVASFCLRKLERLQGQQANGNGDALMASLVGFSHIENAARGCDEPIIQYFVRHTRAQPRDMVVLGTEVAAAARRPHRREGQAAVRNIVRGCARLYGNEQLEACAQQLGAASPPGEAGDPAAYVAQLEEFIREIGSDVFSDRTLHRARYYAGEDLLIDPARLLWQNRLLGYVQDDHDDGRAFFFSVGASATAVPDSRRYVFHPCLIDRLGLDHGGPGSAPVRPVAE